MDMLVPYTPVAELSEEQKRRLKTIASTKLQSGFTVIDGKVVSANEVKGLAPHPAQANRQNLFE